ncbi:MAG: hypothetical protein HY318_18155 [Armatimonadetes bacterium]|nr:hypothetical protein [Armatimonadota bacterium]
MRNEYAGILLSMLIGIGPVLAQRDATITVRPNKVIGPVNPMIFGNNQLDYPGNEEYSNRGSGIWDPDKRAPVAEYVALSKLAGITVQRWPGGCIAHSYNWKLTVGPLSERPNMQFGLPEFLTFCEATNAAPLLTLSVYWGNEKDAADIVEYLNAPNNGANPNGGKDWAAVRGADGHPKPYKVVWFEYGNEDYHGEHKTRDNPNPRKITPEEYAAQYLKYQTAMRAVDPSVKIGGLLQNGLWDWNRVVLKGCGKQMDFAIEHTYIPGYDGNNDEISGRLLMQSCTASDAAIQDIYDRLLAQIRDVTGRQDLKLGITEYNGAFVQERPLPYRQAFANALRNAEHLRVMMQPKNRILMGNFWQFANEYWGMVQGYVNKAQIPVRQANYFPYQLYHEHFGETLVAADVKCGKWDFDGAAGVPARKGQPTEFKLWEENLLPKDYTWEDRKPSGPVTQKIKGNVAVAEFQGQDVNFYFPRVEVPVESAMGYRVTAWVRTDALTGNCDACYQVGDARGWLGTKSCALSPGVRGTHDWTKIEVDYQTLSDTKAIEILARRLEGGGPVSGRAFYRLESVRKFRPANSGAVPDLGVNCARRKDGTVTMMIVNKNLDETVPVSLTVAGRRARPGAAKAWMLTGPSPTANNLKTPDAIGLHEAVVEARDGAYRLEMPACSMAAVEIAP